MSATSMKHETRQMAIELLERQQREQANLINHCLSQIIIAIDDCDGLIHEGNINLFTRTDIVTGNRVVYFVNSFLPYNPEDEIQYNAAVELYSEDGWYTLEDIANWADIAAAYVEEKKAEKKSMD